MVVALCTHTCTHAHARVRTHAHYDILSDIMIILDHGNILCRHHFHDIIMHSFRDIEEMRFFAKYRYLKWWSQFAYTYMHHKTTFFDNENIRVDTIFEMI